MQSANPRILTINGGSSSIKFALFEAGDLIRRILEGSVERIGLPEATMRVEGLNPTDNFSRPVAALGRLDTLVFAGGIGGNAPTVRARICDGLGFLRIELEEHRNVANEGVISAAGSRATVVVIRTDEECMITKTICRVLGLGREKEN